MNPDDPRISNSARQVQPFLAMEIFERSQDLIVCTGDAQIDDGCDRITAEEIQFDTRREVFKAYRNVQVNMNREDPACTEDSS